MELSTAELILYGLVGSFGAASVIVFVWGFITYITRLGTERSKETREEGIHLMEWAVTILVVVVLLSGILRHVLAS